MQLCSITIVQHLRLDYCENLELAWKETIDNLRWNISYFFLNIVIILVNIGNHLLVYNKCSNPVSYIDSVMGQWNT